MRKLSVLASGAVIAAGLALATSSSGPPADSRSCIDAVADQYIATVTQKSSLSGEYSYFIHNPPAGVIVSTNMDYRLDAQIAPLVGGFYSGADHSLHHMSPNDLQKLVDLTGDLGFIPSFLISSPLHEGTHMIDDYYSCNGIHDFNCTSPRFDFVLAEAHAYWRDMNTDRNNYVNLLTTYSTMVWDRKLLFPSNENEERLEDMLWAKYLDGSLTGKDLTENGYVIGDDPVSFEPFGGPDNIMILQWARLAQSGYNSVYNTEIDKAQFKAMLYQVRTKPQMKERGLSAAEVIPRLYAKAFGQLNWREDWVEADIYVSKAIGSLGIFDPATGRYTDLESFVSDVLPKDIERAEEMNYARKARYAEIVRNLTPWYEKAIEACKNR